MVECGAEVLLCIRPRMIGVRLLLLTLVLFVYGSDGSEDRLQLESPLGFDDGVACRASAIRTALWLLLSHVGVSAIHDAFIALA